MYENVDTGIREVELGHIVWGKVFVRDDGLVVIQATQYKHETLILRFD